MLRPRVVVSAAIAIASLLVARAAWRRSAALQFADPAFVAAVARPAYTSTHPRVAIDEGHHNIHTASGTYRPFAELLRHDGYDVVAFEGRFTATALEPVRVLVIANALGAPFPFMDAAHHPAFTDEECDAVVRWVERGGALLLIADHAPAGAAARGLAAKFGVRMSGRTLHDSLHAVPPGPGTARHDGWLVFSRENYMLGAHPVVEGRDPGERVRRVVTFTGQSLVADANAVPILRASDAAGDVDPATGRETTGVNRTQLVVRTFGRGRVAIAGDAAFLTAQVTNHKQTAFGMQHPASDDRQLALNLAHWLSGLLR